MKLRTQSIAIRTIWLAGFTLAACAPATQSHTAPRSSALQNATAAIDAAIERSDFSNDATAETAEGSPSDGGVIDSMLIGSVTLYAVARRSVERTPDDLLGSSVFSPFPIVSGSKTYLSKGLELAELTDDGSAKFVDATWFAGLIDRVTATPVYVTELDLAKGSLRMDFLVDHGTAFEVDAFEGVRKGGRWSLRAASQSPGRQFSAVCDGFNQANSRLNPTGIPCQKVPAKARNAPRWRHNLSGLCETSSFQNDGNDVVVGLDCVTYQPSWWMQGVVHHFPSARPSLEMFYGNRAGYLPPANITLSGDTKKRRFVSTSVSRWRAPGEQSRDSESHAVMQDVVWFEFVNASFEPVRGDISALREQACIAEARAVGNIKIDSCDSSGAHIQIGRGPRTPLAAWVRSHVNKEVAVTGFIFDKNGTLWLWASAPGLAPASPDSAGDNHGVSTLFSTRRFMPILTFPNPEYAKLSLSDLSNPFPIEQMEAGNQTFFVEVGKRKIPEQEAKEIRWRGRVLRGFEITGPDTALPLAEAKKKYPGARIFLRSFTPR